MKRIVLSAGIATLVLVCLGLTAAAQPGDTGSDRFFDVELPAGWLRSPVLPDGIRAGFLKPLAEQSQASFFVRYETMPPEVGEPPQETPEMQQHFVRLVKKQFPDAVSITPPSLQVGGTVLRNLLFEMGTGDQKARMWYVYFSVKPAVFIVQCTAPAAHWDESAKDFATMLASLKPRAGVPPPRLTPEEAVSEAKRVLPNLVASYPAEWGCTIKDVSVLYPRSKDAKRMIQVIASFKRSDIFGTYVAARTTFRKMAQGAKTDDPSLQNLPEGELLADFFRYLGQIWGTVFGIAANCQPPVEAFQVLIADPFGKRIGTVTISRDDAAEIVAGKVKPDDHQRIGRMYDFE